MNVIVQILTNSEASPGYILISQQESQKHFALKMLKQIRKLVSQKCFTGMNCDLQDTVLPKYSKCQEKVVLCIWKSLSVSAFPVATKWYVETTGGCYLIGLIISKFLFFF